MALGFPALAKANINVLHDSDFKTPELRNHIVETMNRIGWKSISMNTDVLLFQAPWSIWSWGENIELEIGMNSTITICSKSFQIFDWGKNRTNLYRFSSAFALHYKHQLTFKEQLTEH